MKAAARCAQILFALVFGASTAKAFAADVVNVIFINGIQNTLATANTSRVKLADILRNSSNRSAAERRSFKVELIWNPIGFYGTTVGRDLRQDVMELFIEKVAEEHFLRDFPKILAPHNASAALDRTAAEGVKLFLDHMTPGDNSLEVSGDITEADMAMTKTAVSAILDRLRATGPRIVVAHSQANLLANLAWAAYVSEKGQDARKTVRFVNVANSSRFSISGLNLTHAGDQAIFSAPFRAVDVSLEALPSKSGWWRKTDSCDFSTCNFVVSAPTFGGRSIPTTGLFDHAFVDTYLSESDLPAVSIDQGVSFTPGKTRFVDRFEDLVYAAATSLELENSKCADEPVAYDVSVAFDWNLQYKFEMHFARRFGKKVASDLVGGDFQNEQLVGEGRSWSLLVDPAPRGFSFDPATRDLKFATFDYFWSADESYPYITVIVWDITDYMLFGHWAGLGFYSRSTGISVVEKSTTGSPICVE